MDARTFAVAHQDDILRDIQAFVERETPSTDKSALDAFATFLAEYARRMNGDAKIIPVSERGNHVRVTWGSGSGKPALLIGHFDTVWPIGTLEKMPFRVEAGNAFGPGIFDMKSGLAQGFWAMRILREVLGSERPVVYLCNADEEIGSPTSRELIEHEARGAAAVFVLEPSHHGALKTGRKGVGIFHVEVSGRAAHAGLDPFAGVSAIDELARIILELHGLTNRETGSTVNVGVITGGTRSNVTAAHATAEVDLRVATQAEAERMTRAILGVRPHLAGAEVMITGGMNRPPMERTPDTVKLFTLAQRLAGELGFTVEEAQVGGGSDGNFCAALGVPVLDGLGAVGDGAHALHEHIEVESVPLRAALLASLLARVEL